MGITVRGGLPLVIERGVSQTLSFEILREGALYSPASGTITILDDTGTVIVSAASLTISSGTATYALLSSSVPATLQPAERWQATLIFSVAGLSETVKKDAILALNALHPVLATADLVSRHSDLNSLLPASISNWDVPIKASYEVITRRLLQKGRRPWLIMSPWSLFDTHLNLALALVFRDLETYTSGPGKYAEMAKAYEEKYAASWDALEFAYDNANSGDVRSASSSVAAQPSIWLC